MLFTVIWQGLKRVLKNKQSQEVMLVGMRSGKTDDFHSFHIKKHHILLKRGWHVWKKYLTCDTLDMWKMYASKGGRSTMLKDGQRKEPTNMVGSMINRGGKSGVNNTMAEGLFWNGKLNIGLLGNNKLFIFLFHRLKLPINHFMQLKQCFWVCSQIL